MQAVPEKEFCNVRAIQLGVDPVGHAGHFDDAIVFEAALPWKREMYKTAGTIPQELLTLMETWLERYRAGQPYNHRPLLVAPDPLYSRPGHRRVMFYTRPAEAFAHYTKCEYVVPEALTGPLIWALYEAHETLPDFEAYRTPEADTVRDILVCTHGTVDVACAKFGYPLYRHLRDRYADETVRVWRVSHFGGHLFAPTLMDMPIGHYWAYIEPAQTDQLMARNGDAADLRGYYRGWSGMGRSFAQAAEREMWQRIGWAWFDYAKQGVVLAQDENPEDPQWADVQITYTAPDGTTGVCTLHVEVTHHIETQYSTDSAETHPYPQYAVAVLNEETLALHPAIPA